MRRRWPGCVAGVLFCLALAGCGNEPAPPTADAPPKAVAKLAPKPSKDSVSKDAVSKVRKPPPDKSLTIDQYVEAGMPAPDQLWIAAELTRAATSIEKMNLLHVPRFESDRSGIVFARIVARDFLAYCEDESLPFGRRITEAMGYYEAMSRIYKRYLLAYGWGIVGNREFVEILGAVLRGQAAQDKLANQFFPTLDENLPDYQIRMEGFQKMQRGSAMTMVGSLQILREPNRYSPSDLKLLVSYFTESFPTIFLILDPPTRRAASIEIGRYAADPQLMVIWPELAELLEAVEQTLDMPSGAKKPEARAPSGC